MNKQRNTVREMKDEKENKVQVLDEKIKKIAQKIISNSATQKDLDALATLLSDRKETYGSVNLLLELMGRMD